MNITAMGIKASAILAILSIPALALPQSQAPSQNQTRNQAQNQAQSQAAASAMDTKNVLRTIKAMSYRRSGGATKISFQATNLMSGAFGEAKVQNKSNRTEVEAKFDGLQSPSKFGLEYLTYVLWAVSPQGRAENLGELPVKGGVTDLRAITDLQTFGMIVTAEPYFAVTQPGDMVVLENGPAIENPGKAENIEATFELLSRGAYSSSNTKIENAIFGIDPNTPLSLFEARNAVRIARNAQADRYAGAALAKAEDQLTAAEGVYRAKRDRKAVETASRDVVETAEEARVMAVKQKAEADAQAALAAQKQAAEEREAQEARRRQEAEQARLEAERVKQQAEQAAQQAQQEREQAQVQQQAAEAKALEAAQAKAAAEAETARAQQLAANAESEKAQLRAQLLAQFNAVLQTRDSARGLIVNMSDVLFDTGSHTLLPGAREKLAKISGILLAHPGLNLQIEGHTDSVGTDDYNQQLSERRADSVRDYLAGEGIAGSSMTAQGFGKTQPIASNDTSDGRQRNRRVELVVNGESIESKPADASNQPADAQR